MNPRTTQTSCRLVAVLGAVFALAVAGAACYNSNTYLPISPSNPHGFSADEVVRLTASPEAIPADGISRTVLTARIDAAATIRKIAFDTSLGTLVSGNQKVPAQTGSLSIDADVGGVATLELQSAATVAMAKVTATITLPSVEGSQSARTFVRTLDVPFSSVDLDRFLRLTADRTTLPADGSSRALVTAELLFDGDRRQAVTFSSTRGSLFRVGSTAAESMPTVTASASGLARVQLRAETTVGIASVMAEVLGLERELVVQFVPVGPRQ